MGNLIEYRCGLIDFQVGRDHGKLRFNPAEYIEQCAKSGMKRVMFTCKDAYGDAYYVSDLVELNSMADEDYFQIALKKAHELNMELYAYYNVLLDDIYAENNPGHRMTDLNGNPVISYEYYKSLCPNSPYSDILRERIADLVFNYDADGLFLDISYFSKGTCFCEYCRNEFRQMYGYKLEDAPDSRSPGYDDFDEFKRKSRAQLLISITETVHEIRDIPVIWNGSGSIYLAEPETDDHSAYLTTEFHAPDYLDGITRAKWMQSRGVGFIMSIPSELGSWGDWTMVPENTLKSVVCSIAAHGGGVFYNHTPYPSGPYAKSHIKPVAENIGKAYEYLRGFEEYLKNSTSAADTAVLFSIETKRFGSDGFDYFKSLKGAVKILLSSGIPFDVMDERRLKEGIGYKLLLAPGTDYLEDDTLRAIEDYVSNGGLFIAAGDFPDAADEMLGIKKREYSEMSVEYLTALDKSISSGLPDMPILIKEAGRLPDIRISDSAVKLAGKCKPPFEASLKRHVYHQHAHPFEETDFASMIMNEYGRGKCIYFSANLFKSYMQTASPWLRKIIINSILSIHSNPIVLLDAPECVYSTIVENKDGYLLQLININGPIYEPSKIFPETMLPVKEVFVKTELSFSDCEIVASDPETETDFTSDGIYIRNLGMHTAVFFKK